MKQILVIGFLMLTRLNAYTQSPALSVRVPNIKTIEGELQMSIYNSPETFMKEGKEAKICRFKITKTNGEFVIRDLPQGEYALIIYHDANNNKKMDRSLIGIPKEGYAFSKNFKPKFSAPGFEDCSINLNQDISITINLMY